MSLQFFINGFHDAKAVKPNKLFFAILIVVLFFSNVSFASNSVVANKLFGGVSTYHNYNNWGANPSSTCGYINGHTGVDIQTQSKGTEIFYSLTSGQVISTNASNANGIIIYDPEKNISAIYLHASSALVSVGQTVSIGTEIGRQGCAGFCFGPHVHLEFRRGRHTSAACNKNDTLDPISTAMSYLSDFPSSPSVSLLSPANGVINISPIALTLSWSASNATGHRYVIAKSSNFTGFIDDGGNSSCNSSQCYTAAFSSSDSSLSVIGFRSWLASQTPGTFYWKVRSNGPGGASAWTNTRSFSTVDTIAPTIPSSAAVFVLSSTELSLTWFASTDSGGSGLAGYKIERCTGSGCTNFVQVAQVAHNITSFNNSGLSANTHYRYRIRAFDNAGNHSNYSTTVFGVTNQAQVSNPPTVITVSSIASETTVGSVSVFARINPNGLATTYFFEYGLTSSLGLSTQSQSAGSGTADSNYSSSINGLQCNTTYHYRAVARNSAGTANGLVRTFTLPCLTTYTLTVTSAGGSNVAVTGNLSAYNGTTNYTINNITANTSVTLTAPASSGGATFIGWSNCDSSNTANRTCSITINANKSVSANYTNVVAPTASTLIVTEANIGQTSAVIMGSVNANGSATMYWFDYGTTASFGQTTAEQSAGSGSQGQQVNASLSGLQCGQTYHFRLSARNAAGTTRGVSRTFSTLSCSSRPANDNFINSIEISGTNATVSGSNIGASVESGEPNHDAREISKSVWWYWNANADGSVTIDTFGSDFDTILAVYTGSQLGSLASVASNDDARDTRQSEVVFHAVAGTTYRIAVDGYNGLEGVIALNLQQSNLNETPLVTTGLASQVSINTATLNGSIIPNGSATHYWLAYGLSINLGLRTAEQSVDNQNQNSNVSISISGLECNTTYYYALAARNNAGMVLGDIRSFNTLNCEDGNSPTNDNLVNAFEIVGINNTVYGDNRGATLETGEPSHAGRANNSVWWRWTAGFTGTVTINTSGSSFDTVLAVYTGTNISSLISVASNDDTDDLLQSEVSFSANLGTTYYIAVDSFDGQEGNIVLNLRQESQLLPIVSTSIATDVSRTSITLNAWVNPNGRASVYWFEYGTTQTLGRASSEKAAGNSVVSMLVSEGVENLLCGQTLFFRIAARNNEGTVYGETRSQSLLDCQSESAQAPFDFNVREINNRRVLLSWSVAVDSKFREILIERCTGLDCNNFTQIGYGDLILNTYLDVNLIAGNTFRYRIRGRSENGDLSTYTPIISIDTPVQKKRKNNLLRLILISERAGS